MENRLQTLESTVSDLRVANGQLSVSVEHLTEKVEELSRSVSKLNDTISKSKGALFVVLALGTGVGVLIEAATTWFRK